MEFVNESAANVIITFQFDNGSVSYSTLGRMLIPLTLQHGSMPIVATDDVMGGKPRLEGRRISVLQVAELVLDHGEDPATVSDQFDISLAEVHEGLAYYYDNLDEMETYRQRRADLVDQLEAESEAPDAIER